MEKGYVNILLLCSYESTYVTQLWENIKRCCPGIKLSLLTKSSAKYYYQSKIILEKEEKIYFYRSSSVRFWLETEKNLRKLPEFDIIHSLWMEKTWGWHARTLKRKTNYWFCSVGGSDLYRDSKKLAYKTYQLNILNHADWFSSENSETKKEFLKTYGQKYETVPHTINRFGVDIFDAIIRRKNSGKQDKHFFNVPTNKIIICCGYNANSAHQHITIIKILKRLPQSMLEKLFFIFPMTYGENPKGYTKKIRDALNELTNNYVILEKFMNTDEMAAVVESTDIMIHVQTTDQMSSTMLAHMFNGNVVIAGSWLPYNSLKERGIYFVNVNKIEELDKVLTDVIENLELYKNKCNENKALVYAMSSWDSCIKEWVAVYESLMEARVS